MKYIIELKYSILNKKDIKEIIEEKLKINKNIINDINIIKESIDARDKNNILYNNTYIVDLKKEVKNKYLKEYKEIYVDPEFYNVSTEFRPVIVGYGPSSMFCALYLAKCNLKPIIIERGSELEKRIKKINDFNINKILDIESNVVFGEGGAGTYSDGKLNSNVNNIYNQYILRQFIKCGAYNNILYESKPHIGSDVLQTVLINFKKELLSYGVDFYFDTKFINFKNKSDYIEVYTNKNHIFKTRHLILGIGHSAYDTICMLKENNIYLEKKPFSIGVRIEHPKDYVNKMQYGNYANLLPTASYKLACHLEKRSVYTFCMCPGGFVIPSQNYNNHICINGMSNQKRDNYNSNSAILVEIHDTDLDSDDVLAGFKFIHDIERRCFSYDKSYKAPANLLKEQSLNLVAKDFRSVKTTYPHGIVFTNLYNVLPNYVVDSIIEGLKIFNNKMNGFFMDDAILIACETRSTSPVRIKRDSNFLSSNKYIYPIGEGAGYAGGIMSSAIDGLKCAINIVSLLKK